ncbi:aminotransferase class V-fold PLP-dependent enzyme [Dyella flagellata]
MRAWRNFVSANHSPFTTPGHKRRAGELHPDLGRLLDADVPLLGGLDSMRLEAGLLKDAERRAARLWQADWCRFSVAGSTHANQALCLAVGKPGDTVLVSRTAHRSVLLGLVLAGLRPVWLPTEIDARFGIPSQLSLSALEQALRDHRDAVAVFCVEPSYVGTVSDLAAIVRIAHARNVPVIVDQAWGAHFGFAPGYPAHALSAGADAMVISLHKTLPTFSQGAMVLARCDLLNRVRFDRAFEASHTTSPSGAILASIDSSRALLASGLASTMLTELAERVASLRTELRSVGLTGPSPEDFPTGRFDPAKLVLQTAASGYAGLDIERELIARGMPLAMANKDMLVALVSLMDGPDSLQVLKAGLLAAVAHQQHKPRAVEVSAAWSLPVPTQALSPREAFFASHETVPLEQALHRISTEAVTPYPPGIPVLLPGERITADTLATLRNVAATKTRIAYVADPDLQTLQVVRDIYR